MNYKCESEFIDVILERLAHYLDGLAGHVFDVEETIGAFVSTAELGGENVVKNLQVLDFLRQSLEDLAILATACHDPRMKPLNYASIEVISSKLRLEATRNLLVDKPLTMSGASDDELGELDLF